MVPAPTCEARGHVDGAPNFRRHRQRHLVTTATCLNLESFSTKSDLLGAAFSSRWGRRLWQSGDGGIGVSAWTPTRWTAQRASSVEVDHVVIAPRQSGWNPMHPLIIELTFLDHLGTFQLHLAVRRHIHFRGRRGLHLRFIPAPIWVSALGKAGKGPKS